MWQRNGGFWQAGTGGSCNHPESVKMSCWKRRILRKKKRREKRGGKQREREIQRERERERERERDRALERKRAFMCVCVCLCARVREKRERERESVGGGTDGRTDERRFQVEKQHKETGNQNILMGKTYR